MDKNLPDIDQYFKDALEDYAETPPAFVWEGINESLGEKPLPSGGAGSALLSVPAWLIVLVSLLPPQSTQIHALTWVKENAVKIEKQATTKTAISGTGTGSLFSKPFWKEREAGNSPNGNKTKYQEAKRVFENKPIESKQTGTQQAITRIENKTGRYADLEESDIGQKQENILKGGENITVFAEKQTETTLVSKQKSNMANQASFDPGKAEIILAAAGANTIPEKMAVDVEKKMDIFQIKQIDHQTPVGPEKQVANSNQADDIILNEAALNTLPENTPSNEFHYYSKQLLLQSRAVKKVPLVFATPATPGRNAGTEALIAALKPAKLPHHLTWSVNGYYRPEWQQKQMGRLENDRHDGPRNDRQAIRRQEPNINSFTTGLVAGVQLGNGLIIESGISMFDQTSTNGRQLVRPRPDSGGAYKLRFDFAEGYTHIKLKNGNPPGANDSVIITSATTTIRYVGVPLQVSYPFKFGKFFALPSAGITYQWLTTGKLDAQVQQGTDKHQFSENKISGLKNSFLSGQAGISLEYRISPALRFQLAPTYRFALNPVNKGAAVQYYPAAWGVGLGIRWTMR